VRETKRERLKKDEGSIERGRGYRERERKRAKKL